MCSSYTKDIPMDHKQLYEPSKTQLLPNQVIHRQHEFVVGAALRKNAKKAAPRISVQPFIGWPQPTKT